MNYEESWKSPEEPKAVPTIPRLNRLTIKCQTVEFGTNRVKKEWNEYVTFFTFFNNVMDVN